MEKKIKELLQQMVQHVQQDIGKHTDNRNVSYHMIMKDDPKIRLSVLYRPRRFVVSIHYIDGPNRGKTIARIVENEVDLDKGSYFNEDWLYPEAYMLQRLK